jgi:hypothetical protein
MSVVRCARVGLCSSLRVAPSWRRTTKVKGMCRRADGQYVERAGGKSPRAGSARQMDSGELDKTAWRRSSL